jgi:regulator of PEP synthase PpsR (kinase-PPPase family)
MVRHVFIISDGTGITAEILSQSLISQFEGIEFKTTTIPYVDSQEKAHKVIKKIELAFKESKVQPILFTTLVRQDIRAIFRTSPAQLFDLFSAFIKPLESTLEAKSSYTIGRTHGLVDKESYKERIAAIDYTLLHDDGINIKNYEKADIILLGVSRSGKTPTCLYMALQYGVLAANYPLTEDDLEKHSLPEFLNQYRHKLFGLTIKPEKLYQIRQERRPSSQYASLSQCKREVVNVLNLFKQEKIHYLNSTDYSIEEISTRIMAKQKIKRRI